MPISTSVLPFDPASSPGSPSPALTRDEVSEPAGPATADFADVFADSAVVAVGPAATKTSAAPSLTCPSERVPAVMSFGGIAVREPTSREAPVKHEASGVPTRRPALGLRIPEMVLSEPGLDWPGGSSVVGDVAEGGDTAASGMPLVPADDGAWVDSDGPLTEDPPFRPTVMIEAIPLPPMGGWEQSNLLRIAVDAAKDHLSDAPDREGAGRPLESRTAIDDEGQDPSTAPRRPPASFPHLRPFFGVTETVPVTIPMRFVVEGRGASARAGIGGSHGAGFETAAPPAVNSSQETEVASASEPHIGRPRETFAAEASVPGTMMTARSEGRTFAALGEAATFTDGRRGMTAPMELRPAGIVQETQRSMELGGVRETPGDNSALESVPMQSSASRGDTDPLIARHTPLLAAPTRDRREIAKSLTSTPIGALAVATSPSSSHAPVVVPAQGENTPDATVELPGKNLSIDARAVSLVQPADSRGSDKVREKSAGADSLHAVLRGDEGAVSPQWNKKISLEAYSDGLTNNSFAVGIETAKPLVPMLHELRQTDIAALTGDAAVAVSGSAVTSGNLPSVGPDAGHPAAAVKAIRQITDAADVLWATDRTGVNLKLKLEDVGVAVNVAYRDGEIRATFHTDSAGLREALSSAWEAHAVSVADQKPYRLAEPVFSSSGSSSGGGSSSQGFSLGGDSSRHPPQQSSDGNDELDRAGRQRAATGETGSPVVVSPRPIHSSDISGRLHAFA